MGRLELPELAAHLSWQPLRQRIPLGCMATVACENPTLILVDRADGFSQ
jgi:hypothetical protein